MSTIPASAIVNVIPNVLGAGGNQLVMNGVFLTLNTRVPISPIGSFLSFPSAISVSNYFGPASVEYQLALKYYGGYVLNTQLPGAMYFCQAPMGGAAAYVRGAQINTLTIAQLQAITGSLSVVMDGYTHTYASVNISAASSFSAAAGLLQTGLNTTPAAGATTATSTLAAGTPGVVNGSISGNVMTVNSVTSGIVYPGAVVTGVGVAASTTITNQLTGTTGGIGTYAVNNAQVIASETLTMTWGLLTIGTVSVGTVSVGQTVTGSTTLANSIITFNIAGTGAGSTWVVNLTQVVTSFAAVMIGTPITVTFDSTAGAFVITSGLANGATSVAFPTGTAAAALLLTSATGAVTSNGSAGLLPSALMNDIVQINTNWASFQTTFDPDGGIVAGVSGGNGQKQLFAAWVNQTSPNPNEFAYLCWDSDVTPTLTLAATTSLGYILNLSLSNGTCVIYDPANASMIAAFIAGAIACVNFQAVNGRITFAFRQQAGMIATVTNQTVGANLIANGYNFYGAYATANQGFVFFYPGSISGVWQWLDSYVNEIAMNAAFQVTLMTLLTTTNSIPYNAVGMTMIETACLGVINQYLNFGALRSGVQLSQTQIVTVNTAAGLRIDDILFQRGWYFQALLPTQSARQNRQTPLVNFWYCDGEAVQQITLNSIDIL